MSWGCIRVLYLLLMAPHAVMQANQWVSILREALAGGTRAQAMVWHRTQPAQEYLESVSRLPYLVITVMNTLPRNLWVTLAEGAMALFQYAVKRMTHERA